MLLFLMPKINNNTSKQSSRHTVPSLNNRNQFLPREPHGQYEKTKRQDTRKWAP